MATITSETYTLVMNERTALIEKLRQATQNKEEFLITHYTRMLRMCDKSYDAASRANITFERKVMRKEVKVMRDAIKKEKESKRSED